MKKTRLAFWIWTAATITGLSFAVAWSWLHREELSRCKPGYSNQLVVIFIPSATQTEKENVLKLLRNGNPGRTGNSYVFSDYDKESMSAVRSLPYVAYVGNPPALCTL